MDNANVRQINKVHQEDVIAQFDECSTIFGDLATILRVILTKAEEHSEIRNLADAGWRLAIDYENCSDGWSEEVRRGGIRQEKIK